VVHRITDNLESLGDLPAKVERLEKLAEMTPILSRALNETQEKNAKLSADLVALQTEHAALKAQHEAVVSLLEGLQKSTDSRLDDLQRHVSDRHTLLQEQLEGLRASGASIERNLAEFQNSTESNLQDHRKRLGLLKDNMKKLIEEHKQLASSHQDLESQFSENKKRQDLAIVSKESRCRCSTCTMEALESDVDELVQQRFADLKKLYSRLEKRCNELQRDQAMLELARPNFVCKHDLAKQGDEFHKHFDLLKSELEKSHNMLQADYRRLEGKIQNWCFSLVACVVFIVAKLVLIMYAAK
jgi:chromosome segregation ATPase